ncbi:hypothetical protein F5B20DRAFT_216354 [Whalleya microplaca]|nr:hypothetical protein F5B20DRAFT_216354 [Whalleya microplaca]
MAQFFLFYHLPRELRDMILRFAIWGRKKKKFFSPTQLQQGAIPLGDPRALLLVSKGMHADALPIIFQNVILKYRRTGSGINSLEHFTIPIYKKAWRNVRSFELSVCPESMSVEFHRLVVRPLWHMVHSGALQDLTIRFRVSLDMLKPWYRSYMTAGLLGGRNKEIIMDAPIVTVSPPFQDLIRLLKYPRIRSAAVWLVTPPYPPVPEYSYDVFFPFRYSTGQMPLGVQNSVGTTSKLNVDELVNVLLGATAISPQRHHLWRIDLACRALDHSNNNIFLD